MDEIVDAIVSGAKTGETVYLGPGRYVLNIDLPDGSEGMHIIGASRNRTKLISAKPNTPVFACRGLWYSKFSGLFFSHGHRGDGTMPAVDIDSAVGGRGVQGNTWQDCAFDGRGWFDGQLGHSAFSMCRTAQNDGQGSENCFINCHFYGSEFACYSQVGYNALSNSFQGGNFQSYTKHGVYLQAGSLHLHSVGFQSTVGIEQIENDGYDIWANGGGVGDSISINACRTESLRFFLGSGAQPPLLTNCLQRTAIAKWSPNYLYTAGIGIHHDGKLYKVLRDFTSGPTFTTSDLKHVPFNVIESTMGKELNCNWQLGDVAFYNEPDNIGKEVNADYKMTYRDKWVAVNCANNNAVIELYDAQKVPAGHEVVVTRMDNNPTYTCNVYAPYIDNQSSFNRKLTTTISGRSARFQALGGGDLARRWYGVD